MATKDKLINLEDLKVLSDHVEGEVTDLKSDLDLLAEGQITITSDDLEQGTYNAQGATSSNPNRIRTKGFLNVRKGESVSFDVGANVGGIFVGYFTTSGTFIRDGSWMDAKYSIQFDDDYKVILVFRKGNPAEALIPSEYDATTVIMSKWVISNNTIKEETETELNGVKASVEDLSNSFNVETVMPENLLDFDTVTFGKYKTNAGTTADNSDYWYSDYIPVEAGKTYSFQRGNKTTAQGRSYLQVRWVSCYDSQKNILSDKGTSTWGTSFVVPNGVSYIVLSSGELISPKNDKNASVVEGTELVDYTEYFAPYRSVKLKNAYDSEQTDENTAEIAKIKTMLGSEDKKAIFSATSDSLSANTNLICCESSDNKKNEYIELTAKFSSFDELTISHGKGSYMGKYITITPSKIIIYEYNGTQLEEFTHGLTISNFINVIIYTKNDSSCRSKITIMSTGGDYTAETTRFYASYGSVLCSATFEMTDVEMRYTINDAKEEVWVFGDSYISMGDPNRWATQMVSNGHKNALLCGYGGAQSTNEIVPFRAFLEVATPKYLVWCLGMNDADTNSAVNANWKTCVDEVIATCEEKGITPVLATIPNVPNINNSFKNAYVKASGKRYVDFAKAVNAESVGATWYSGMLSSDNTHPTALGAKALMRQFLLDVPEVLYAEE